MALTNWQLEASGEQLESSFNNTYRDGAK